jgi:hypothetical protein
MMGERFKDQEHLLRIAALFLAGVIAFVVARAVLVPKGFGVYGHFRAGALEDNRERPVVFAGHDACEACHSDVSDARKGGKHEKVSCEACHGAQNAHASAEDPSAQKPTRPDAAVCVVCHLANVGKPKGFPQIKLKDHAEPGTCLTCHKAHKPGAPPEASR